MKTRFSPFMIGVLCTGMATVCLPMLPALARQSTPQTPQRPAQPPAQRQGPPVPPAHQHSEPAAPASLLGPPPLEITPPIMDIGEIRPSKRMTGTAKIVNISDKWVRIVQAKADCTCTSVEISDMNLAPGQATTLTADYAANNVMGEKKGIVRIFTEGYDMIEVPVRAFVTMPVRAEPAFVAALKDPVTGQLPLSGEFTVMSNDLKPFKVTAINSEPPLFINFDPAKDEPRNNYRLKWDFMRYDQATCMDSQGRRMPGWVIIETDHPECPVFDMEIRNECNRRQINRADTWIVQDKRVLLGGLSAGQPTEFEVHAQWKRDAARTDIIKIAVSESNQFAIELVSVTPVEDGLLCKLRMTPAANHKGLLMGTLRLHSNYQSYPLVLVGSVK